MTISVRSPANKILVVDDDDGAVLGLTALLECAGYQTLGSATGQAACITGMTATLGLIFLDLRLSDGCGIDVLRRLRTHGVRAPVVMMTGFGSVFAAVEALKEGATDFVEKPLIGDDVISLARRYYVPTPTGTGDARVDAAIALMQDEIAHAPRTRDLARRLGMSESALRQLFRSTVGRPIGGFRRDLSLDAAAELLRTGSPRISDVANAVGYPDLSSFSRAYKRRFGRPATTDRGSTD